MMRQPTKESIVPQGNPLQGGQRRYVQTVPILRNEAGNGFYSAVSAGFEITIPSARLYVSVTFGFMPDDREDVTIPSGWTVSMDAWARSDSKGLGQGRRVRGNSIIPGPFSLPNQLPLSYEAVTVIDQWRGSVSVPPTGTGLALSGYLVASVTWEPAPGESAMRDEELRELFQACRANPGANAGIKVFETSIVP